MEWSIVGDAADPVVVPDPLLLAVKTACQDAGVPVDAYHDRRLSPDMAARLVPVFAEQDEQAADDARETEATRLGLRGTPAWAEPRLAAAVEADHAKGVGSTSVGSGRNRRS